MNVHLPRGRGFHNEPIELGDKTLAYMQSVTAPAGSILFQAGDLDNQLYIILAGEIELIDYTTGEERVISVRGAGELLGEMSISEPLRKHRLSGRARGEIQFLSLLRDEMDLILQREPLLAYELLQLVNAYLHRVHRRAMHTLEHKNKELSIAYSALEELQSKLLLQERMQHELQLAREIQEQMLPISLPVIPTIDLAAWVLPAQEVCGDFYDAFQLNSETIAFAVGDVCGKGMPAALYMAQTRSLLRAAAMQDEAPDLVLQRVNTHLYEMNRNAMFVTMVYATLHIPTKILTLARAGHDYPLLWANNKITAIATPATGQPLGMISDPILDRQVRILAAGDILLLYTDGVVEAINEQGHFFELQRLYDLMIEQQANPPAVLCAAIFQAVATFRGPIPQADDITLLAIRLADVEEKTTKLRNNFSIGA